MDLQQFWLKYYPENSQRINMASKNGTPYMWMRKTAEWIYLADSNGDFRAAKADESLFKVIVEWLNAIKADREKIKELNHDIIKENVEFDVSLESWTYKNGTGPDTNR